MAFGGKKGGGDFVLESRHLVGLFMLLVVIFGVVFTLGYLLGRSQYDSSLRVANSKASEQGEPADTAPRPTRSNKSGNQTEVSTKALGGDAGSSRKGADWDFYHSAEPKTAEDHLQSPKKTVAGPQAGAAKPSAAEVSPVRASVKAVPFNSSAKSVPLNSSLIPKNAIMLQVAAVQRESDALALAQALQQKKFHAVVMNPGADKFYHVQVGPYSSVQAANAARHDLEAKGFKSIVKR